MYICTNYTERTPQEAAAQRYVYAVYVHIRIRSICGVTSESCVIRFELPPLDGLFIVEQKMFYAYL